MKTKSMGVIILAISVLLGLIVSLQFRSTLVIKQQKASAAFNIEKLVEKINYQKKIQEELKSQIDENVNKKYSMLKTYAQLKNDEKLINNWEDIRLKAGLTDVEGPGITILLDDAPAKVDEDPRLLVIHDEDIRIILNELKKLGAQAMSINGERIVSMSEQVCAGPTIIINRNRYAVPYIISAIGDPDLMYDSLMYNDYIAAMIEDKIRIQIKKSNKILIPKYSKVDKLDRYITGLEVINK